MDKLEKQIVDELEKKIVNELLRRYKARSIKFGDEIYTYHGPPSHDRILKRELRNLIRPLLEKSKGFKPLDPLRRGGHRAMSG